ncbi:MAG: Jag N-terminal domain-containing protein [Ardenticatenaceae bacterium]|nr:Jag N-terminal domain-containing protein [Ardenticatenaceae bacterium]
MSNYAQEIEARGRDVETAVEIGLAELGVRRDDVIIEILDEGSRGLLGIGSRDAVVRLKRVAPVVEPPPPVQVVAEPVQEVIKEAVVETAVPAPPIAPPPAPTAATQDDAETTERTQKEVALDIVQTLIAKMQISATVTASLSEPDDLTGEQIDVIEINGDDLGVLIGPRGETLSTIQYLARLMVSHQMHQRVDFVIDVQGYRQRRQQALARLAERMAKKAMQRGKPIGLEPMPPHERRVIHMTLREHDEVYTESSGEGDRRKVRIIPK